MKGPTQRSIFTRGGIWAISILVLAIGACTQGDGDQTAQTVQVDSTKTSEAPDPCEQEANQNKPACKLVLKSLTVNVSGSSGAFGPPTAGVLRNQANDRGQLTSTSMYLEGKGDIPMGISSYTYYPDGNLQIVETVSSSTQDGNMDTKRTQTFTYSTLTGKLQTNHDVSEKINPTPGDQPRITDTWTGIGGEVDTWKGYPVPDGQGRHYTWAGWGDNEANCDYSRGETIYLDAEGQPENSEALSLNNCPKFLWGGTNVQNTGEKKVHQFDNEGRPIRLEHNFYKCSAQTGSVCKDDLLAEHLNPGMIPYVYIVSSWTYDNEGRLKNFTVEVDGDRDPAQSTGVNGTNDSVMSCDLTYDSGSKKVEPYFANFFDEIGLDTSLPIQSMVCTDEMHPGSKAQFDFEYAYLWEMTELNQPQ